MLPVSMTVKCVACEYDGFYAVVESARAKVGEEGFHHGWEEVGGEGGGERRGEELEEEEKKEKENENGKENQPSVQPFRRLGSFMVRVHTLLNTSQAAAGQWRQWRQQKYLFVVVADTRESMGEVAEVGKWNSGNSGKQRLAKTVLKQHRFVRRSGRRRRRSGGGGGGLLAVSLVAACKFTAGEKNRDIWR